MSTQYLDEQIKVRENPALMKIDKQPNFRRLFTEDLTTLISIFKKYDYELRIVGGAVRDILLNKEPKDVDLVTTTTPLEMKSMFHNEGVLMFNPNGEKHGLITPRVNNTHFEVTTLRCNVATREAKFTKSWELDAKTRDFTINSMYLGFDGTLYDFCFGYEDLQQRRVEFVGDPDARIKENCMRILRYFRFCGCISTDPNKHAQTTLRAIRSNSSSLANVRGERIWIELQKICEGKFVKEFLLKMVDCGLAPYCGLPMNPNVQEFQRFCGELQHFQGQKLPIVYLAALLHNRRDAVTLAKRLKLLKFDSDLAIFIVECRGKVGSQYQNTSDYRNICMQNHEKREIMEQLLKYVFQ